MFLVEKNLYLSKEFIVLVGEKNSLNYLELPSLCQALSSSQTSHLTDSNNFTFLSIVDIFYCVVLQTNILYDYINRKYQ